VFLFLGLVALFRVDDVVTEDFPVSGDDGCFEPVDESNDLCSVVVAADSEVKHFVAPTETDSALVDGVVTNPPEVWVVGGGGVRFGDQIVGVVRG